MAIILVLISCNRNPYLVDIQGESAAIEIKRLEMELFEGDPFNVPLKKEQFTGRYGEFVKLFGYVINIGNIENEDWDENLVSFITDKMNYDVYQAVIELYPDLESVEEELSDAMSYYRYYFPDSDIPNFYSFISGFNNSIVVGDSTLAIGLDRYLGADSKYYPMLGIYAYMSRKMIPERIVPDCIYALAKTTWDEENERDMDLLDAMLYEGKLLYFSRCMQPLIEDSLLFGFSTVQWQFCRNNERQMWDYLVEHDLLFTTDPLTVKKFTGEAPFTSYFTNESPGRAAVWLAFRIIESYMRNNPEVTLGQLMQNRDYQDILANARYSP